MKREGKWCTGCKEEHPIDAFGRDSSRTDGLASVCLASRRVKVQKPRLGSLGRRKWLVETRDGDKRQARRRINYLVERGRLPSPADLPCIDCGHARGDEERRHEYDHARGYDRENQLYVEAVCSTCHHKREAVRSSNAEKQS